MKRIILIMIPILLGVACQKSVSLVSDDVGQIVFSSNLSEVKSIIKDDFSQEWCRDDIVGICGTANGTVIGKNLPYMVNVDEKDFSKASFTPVSESMLWRGKGNYVFYAYSPFIMEDFNHKSLPLSLPELQHYESADDPSGIEEYDVIVAETSIKKEDLTIGEEVEVNFTFRHLYSIVQFDISAVQSLQGKEIHKVMMFSDTHVLAGVKGRADLTEKDKFIRSNAGSRCVSLDFTQKPVLTEDDRSLYFVCLPTDERGCDLHVCVILEDGRMKVFDYKDIVLKSNTRTILKAHFAREGFESSGVSFPLTMSLACRSAQLISAAVLGNTVYFADGTRIERTDDAQINLVGRSYDPFISSTNWTEESSYVITIPLAETFYGKLQVDFKFMTRGLANWKVDWSSDAVSWYMGDGFTSEDSTRSKSYSITFDIDQSLAIPDGGNLYIRIKPADLTPCDEGDVPFFNEMSDPRIINEIKFSKL